jgi:O-antigen/teichoic acid export membrane protein
VLNIILNLALIPRYMAIGAAIATLFTQTFVLSGQIYLVKREIHVGTSNSEIVKILTFMVLSTLLFYIINDSLPLHWMIVLSISILICLLLSFILKIVDFKEVFQVLNKGK